MKRVLFMLFATAFVNCSGGSYGTSKVYRNQKYGNYEFGYEINDPFGASNYRREKGIFNKKGNSVVGVYGLADIDGRTRTVKYTADDNGFKAAIDTNEPGMSDIIIYNEEENIKKFPLKKSFSQNNQRKSKKKFKESLRFDASEIDKMNFVKKYTSIIEAKPLIEYKVSTTTIRSVNNSRNSRNNRNNQHYRNNRNSRKRKLRLYLKPQYDYYYETEKLVRNE